MNLDWVRSYCLSMLHATEDLQWQDNLLFRAGRRVRDSLRKKRTPARKRRR